MWFVLVSLALAAPCTLSGSVVGPTGLLGGVEVVFAPAVTLSERIEGSGGVFELPGEPTARVVTDASGHFVVSELAPGRWHASVVQPGLAPGTVPPILCAPGSAPTVAINLVGGDVTLRGRLTDSAGRVVVGRAVVSRAGDGGTVDGPAYLSVDPGGQFEVVLSKGHVYRLVGLSDGHQPAHEMLYLDRDRVEEGMEVRLELSRAAMVSGRVERAGGGPLSGARIHVGLPSSVSYRAVYSDVSGRFSVDLAHGASYGLGATHPDGWVGCVDRQMSLTPGEHRQGVTLHVGLGRSLRGRVVGPDDHTAADIEVWWRAEGCDLVGTTWTDAAGQFSLPGIPVDQVEVWVPGRGPAVRVAPYSTDVEVMLTR